MEVTNGDSKRRDHARLVPEREWIGVAEVRQSYWRATDSETETASDAEVTDVMGEVEADLDDMPTDGESSDAALEDEPEDVTREQAEEAWGPQAHQILTRVAATYQALIDHSELAAEIQEASGIHTRRQVRSWIGPVLAHVAQLNHQRDEPPLTALVVHKADGTVGSGYDEALRLTGVEVGDDAATREKHAAAARMDCYRWAGASMPSGGGRPSLSPRFEQIQARQRKERRAAEQPNICAVCFMAIPPTGVCDNCG